MSSAGKFGKTPVDETVLDHALTTIRNVWVSEYLKLDATCATAKYLKLDAITSSKMCNRSEEEPIDFNMLKPELDAAFGKVETEKALQAECADLAVCNQKLDREKFKCVTDVENKKTECKCPAPYSPDDGCMKPQELINWNRRADEKIETMHDRATVEGIKFQPKKPGERNTHEKKKNEVWLHRDEEEMKKRNRERSMDPGGAKRI